ncbi:MAG TPA: hypothetical protein VN772_03445 [Solirubrobacteraceae bacterium]|nr:hypothetical protein [Solirubrobacteraceae bacterium]
MRHSYPAGVRPALISLALACSVAFGACGNTLQDKPIPHNVLESLVVNPFPIYWLGGSFHGLSITEASSDPGGGFGLQYGDCLQGGQGTCIPPLRVVTSADNSFLPGGSAASHQVQIRGVPALVAEAGKTIIIATGPVVVDIYASNSALAAAAARTVVPINQPAAPMQQLPAPQADSGYGSTPLPSQEPTPLRPLR